MNEKYKEFLEIVDVPIKSHLLNIGDKETLERYRVLRTEIEDELNGWHEKASNIEEKYANADILAKRYEKFAQIVIKKNVDILYLKYARKLPLKEALEAYNQDCSENEDKLNQFELNFLLSVVSELRY